MKIQAAILDWAGTVVDHGSRAPMGAFVRAFAEFGVTISIANARGPMGMAKWDHFDSMNPTEYLASLDWSRDMGHDPTGTTKRKPAETAGTQLRALFNATARIWRFGASSG